MVLPRSRKVICLCLVLLLQEFGPAHFARIQTLPKPRLQNKQEKADDDENETSEPKNAEENEEDDKDIDEPEDEEEEEEDKEKERKDKKKSNKAERRGFGSAIKNVISVLKFGNKVIPKLLTIAGLSNTVFRAIAGCCPDFPRACDGHAEVEKLRIEVEEKSNRLDAIQFEAKNIQEWAESTSDKFAFVLFELNTIVDNGELLVDAMSPEVNAALAKRTQEIQQLVREKESTGEKLKYLDVQSMYLSTLQIALGITIPIFGTIIPSLPGMVNFAKKRLGIRKTYTLDHSLDGALAKPPASSPKSVEIKSWMAKTKAGITTRLNSFKEKINTKYGGAVKIFGKLGAALGLIFGYVSSAYSIYNIVNTVKTCQTKQDKVLEALEKFKQASTTLDEAIANATRSKQLIEEAWQSLHTNLASAPLLKDLEEVKTVVSGISEPSPELQEAVKKVQKYIDGVAGANEYSALYNLVQELSIGLTSIPFTLICYTNKVKMAEYVLRECKRGSDSFSVLYTQGLQSFDTNAEECRDKKGAMEDNALMRDVNPRIDPGFFLRGHGSGKVGFTYLEKSTVLTGLTKKAEKENFNTDCILNSALRKSQACQQKREGYSDEDIAKRIDVTVEQARALTKDCPDQELTPKQIEQICNLRKFLKNNQIAENLGLELSDVEAVTCPS